MRNSPEVNTIKVNGKSIGISLSADYVAEHEWGINKMKRKFNIDTKTIKDLVRERRSIFKFFKKIPTGIKFNSKSETLHMVKTDNHTYLTSKKTNIMDRELKPKEYDNKMFNQNSIYAGAWDEGDFVIRSKNGSENTDILDVLIEAEKENHLFIGSLKGFDEYGLMIIDGRLIPEDIKNIREKENEYAIKLYQEVLKTKIEDFLKDRGFSYFALTPKMIDGELKFWLNPSDQGKYKSGYFNVEELKLWTENKGPIIF